MSMCQVTFKILMNLDCFGASLQIELTLLKVRTGLVEKEDQVTNMSGIEKLSLLIIRKFKEP